MRRWLIALAAVVGCGRSPAPPPLPDAGGDSGELAFDAGEADAGTSDAGADSGSPADAGVDRDLDGLDDAFEEKVARDYLPYLAVDPGDNCPRGGIVFRLRPHPSNPALLLIVYDHLYEKDCGFAGHDGDDEVFSITVDPAKPPPLGITAMRAISHQNTPCQKI